MRSVKNIVSKNIVSGCQYACQKGKQLFRGLAAAALLGTAGSASALDVMIILDVTGSTGGLLPNWRARMDAEVIQPLKAIDPNARFALASHLDFPFPPHGFAGEYAYRLEAPLDSDISGFLTALNALTSGSGYDTPESQFEAIRQANTGAGLDLNGNGVFTDPGDILPQDPGFNPITNSFTIHFTSPLTFHNDPFNPNYPFVGVVNNPADEAEATAAMVAQNRTYFAMTADPLPAGISADGVMMEKGIIDAQTGEILDTRSAALPIGSTAAARMASATGGRVLSAGADLSGLAAAIEEIIEIVRPCPPGETPVTLPFGVACVPNPDPLPAP